MQQKELDELLTKAKELLKEEMTQISYDTWIKEIEIQSMENGNITLLFSNVFNKDSVDARYHSLVVNTFNYLTNKECSVSILSKEELQKQPNNKSENINYRFFKSYIKSKIYF